MRLRFLHLADVHLGTYHWGSQERARDYGKALRWVANYAAESRSGPGEPVRVVLIAGDLFDKAAIDAATHDEAADAMQAFRRARVGVIVTEGNHDRPKEREVKSWLESFADRDYFAYLNAAFAVGETTDGGRELVCTLERYDPQRRVGSYLDVEGCLRVVGMKYVGHSLRRALDAVAHGLDALPHGEVDRTALMVHGGVEGIIPGYKAEVTRDHLAVLESKIDYLALGHIHKKFTNRDLDDPNGTRGADLREWVYNPGSLAVWRRDEVEWRHGFFDVTIDTALPAGGQEVRFVEPPHRPTVLLRQDVSEAATPADLFASARRIMERERDLLSARERPMAFLVLHGRLRFDRRELDLSTLEALLRDTFQPIAWDVADRTAISEDDVRLDGEWDGPIDRAALEHEVYRQLWLADERDRPHADALAHLTQAIKQDVQNDIPAAEVADHLLAAYRALRAGG